MREIEKQVIQMQKDLLLEKQVRILDQIEARKAAKNQEASG